MRLARWMEELVDLLLPPGCVACGTWVPGGGEAPLVCAPCRSRLRRAPWPRCPRCHMPAGTGRRISDDCRECRGWDPALGFARYAYLMVSPVDRLVHALKYDGWRELAEEMGRAMAELELPAAPGPPSLVVPVPTTARRLRERGYNQAELLARVVARARDLRTASPLARVRGGPTQVSLTPSQRRANVSGAFESASGDGRLEGVHVLLVDDVLTTGATAAAAAATLVRSGARAVTLLTFARALPFAERDGR